MISQIRANKILPNQSVLPTLLFLVPLSLARTEPAVSQEEEIEEIVVTTTRSRRSFEQQPTRVEVLGSEEINEKANMKPGNIRMLLNESTGIHVQQTSPTSFNSRTRWKIYSAASRWNASIWRFLWRLKLTASRALGS